MSGPKEAKTLKLDNQIIQKPLPEKGNDLLYLHVFKKTLTCSQGHSLYNLNKIGST